MFNNTYIKKESYGNTNQILFAIEHQVSVGVVISDTTYVTENGKKIVKAGTPLSGDLTKRDAVFTVYSTVTGAAEGGAAGASVPVGILLHDVDVTYGENNATCLIFGFVNMARIDTETQKMLTESVRNGFKMIQFINQP